MCYAIFLEVLQTGVLIHWYTEDIYISLQRRLSSCAAACFASFIHRQVKDGEGEWHSPGTSAGLRQTGKRSLCTRVCSKYLRRAFSAQKAVPAGCTSAVTNSVGQGGRPAYSTPKRCVHPALNVHDHAVGAYNTP